jgi:hypothetical protein
MIDAYTIGITLALDNGVSEGLATIRRDLIALNCVVEGSATRLKHLTRAAAELQIRPDVAEPIGTGSTVPAPGHRDGAIPVPSDSPRLDPSIFAMSRSDLLMAARTLMPVFSLPAVRPTADVGTRPADRPGMASPEVRSLVPGVPSIASITGQEWGQGAAITDFEPVGYPAQIPFPTATHAVPEDGSGDRIFMDCGAAPPLSAVNDAASPLSPAKTPYISVSPVGEYPGLHPLQQRAAGAQVDASPGTRAGAYDAPAWAHRPSVDSTLPTAVPPPSEPRSAGSQGDIYVDGSRLGRWMTDRLVQAAELPRSATTGFDPRMTPTWPGAPVGA